MRNVYFVKNSGGTLVFYIDRPFYNNCNKLNKFKYRNIVFRTSFKNKNQHIYTSLQLVYPNNKSIYVETITLTVFATI